MILYRILHLVGVMMIFLSLGGLIVRGRLDTNEERVKKLVGLTNGVGLILALIGGFGMLAKLGLGFPGWAVTKLGIWLVFGGSIAVANRKPEFGAYLWWGLIVLGAAAVYLARAKPF